jgi:hypothetical protein
MLKDQSHIEALNATFVGDRQPKNAPPKVAARSHKPAREYFADDDSPTPSMCNTTEDALQETLRTRWSTHVRRAHGKHTVVGVTIHTLRKMTRVIEDCAPSSGPSA